MRLVLKIGSNILADDRGLNNRRLSSITTNASKLMEAGHEVIIVSSGAVAAGTRKMRLKKRPVDIKLKQAAAAVGQSSLMWSYEKSFSKHGLKVAQILLTREGLSNRAMHINAKNTILTLLSHGIVPIVNENDTVATEEIKFGDNDKLASLVAQCAEAERLIILSDVDGLFDKDPNRYKSAKIIHKVDKINDDVICCAGTCTSSYGSGGMQSKLHAAEIATRSGITVNIINGNRPSQILSLLSGKEVGTEFISNKTPLSARKAWIAHGSKSKGSLSLDGGAVKALLKRGKSLLPSGIVSVEGSFNIGDSIKCTDDRGFVIAKGITDYSSEELGRIAGKKTSEIESILGYKYSDEVIHRDNLVITAVTKQE
jgi:glutamate 5-kinase